jgi:hypothetical protein
MHGRAAPHVADRQAGRLALEHGRSSAAVRPETKPKHRRQHAMSDLNRLREELNTLLRSWEYAFAMGHGCTLGDHPTHRAVRQRAADLRARIAEFTE